MRRKRRKLENQKPSIVSRVWKIGVGVVLVLIILDGYLLFSNGVLNIKHIDVGLDKVDCVNVSQIKYDSELLNKNILLISEKEVIQKLTGRYLCIKSVSIQKSLPDRVAISVSGRQAVAELVVIQGVEATASADLSTQSLASASGEIASSSGFAIDSDGVVFAKEVNLNIPKLYYFGKDLSLGRALESVVSNALVILDKLRALGLDVKNAKIYSQKILVVDSVSAPKIIFSLENPLNLQLASLQLILEEAKINNKEMEFVDLRYDKPVVKYTKEAK